MIKEGRAFIITDMAGLRKKAQENRPSAEYVRSLLNSARNINSEELRNIMLEDLAFDVSSDVTE